MKHRHIFASSLFIAAILHAASRPGSGPRQAALAATQMAARVSVIWPQGVVGQVGHPGAWGYEVGVALDGMAAQYTISHNPADLAYVKSTIDRFVDQDGVIHMDGIRKPMRPYPSAEQTLDDIEPGRAVLFLYRLTNDVRYAKAARFLHDQLDRQPRTASGGFWHKQIYPNQMWLDGAYMAGPFLAEYAALFHQPRDYDEVTRQLLLMDAKMRDPVTGLLRHGWDESRTMPWADQTTGLSPEAWARADGWYAMALVDVLDWIPPEHPQRQALVAALRRTMDAVLKYQDPASGLWSQVTDKAGQPGNYHEASASCMFVYALAKGARKRYLPVTNGAAAWRGWDGIQKEFIRQTPEGPVLTGTVRVGGLGGKPYRAGDYAYYIGEKVQDDDPKGVGAYLKAASELQQLPLIAK